MFLNKFLKLASSATLVLMLFSNNANSMESGWMAGIGGDYAFNTHKNHSFSLRHHHEDNLKPKGVVQQDEFENLYTFHMHGDHGFGGSIFGGYLMENGLEVGVELGYKHLKYKDGHNHSGHSHHGSHGGHENGHIHTNNFIGMLKGTYYFDIGSQFYPYLTAGVGMAHVKAEGLIYNDDLKDKVRMPKADEFIKFNDAKANKLYGDAGIGLAVAMNNTIASLGVKVTGIEDMHLGHHGKFHDGCGHDLHHNEFTFGKLSQINYEVEAKVKVLLGNN